MSETTKWVPKGWGGETVIHDGDGYCGKILYIMKDHFCSVHYHCIKDECFFCNSGSVLVEIIHHDDKKWMAVYDPKKKPESYAKFWGKMISECKLTTVHEIKMVKGSVLHVPPLTIHRFRGLTDAELFEVSTHHDELDSFRIVKGD